MRNKNWSTLDIVVCSGSTLFDYEVSNILVDDKIHTFCEYAL